MTSQFKAGKEKIKLRKNNCKIQYRKYFFKSCGFTYFI